MTTPNTNTEVDPLAGALAKWRQTVEAELKGVPFEKKLVTRTPEGIALQPLYTPADLAELNHHEAGPGEAPFVRGVRQTGYKKQAWEFCQELSESTPELLNKVILSDLMVGQNSIQLPGYSENIGDVLKALTDVSLSAIPVHFRAAQGVSALGRGYLDFAKERGFDTMTLRGSVTADPLSFWVQAGCLKAPLDDLFNDLAAWVKAAAGTAPALKTIGVDATPWSDAGASCDQELAFALAAGVSYLKQLQARGVSPSVASAKMRFTFAAGPKFFMEIAKFRAFRLLWSQVLKAFGVEPTADVMPAVHARTSRYNKTLHDAHVNMLRVTTEALSAVLGGVDSLHIAPYDEVSGVTDNFSRRIARNLHTILAEEFSFTEIADPSGGSWYVEKITDELSRKSWSLFQKIEAEGGLPEALRKGVPQQLVTAVADEKSKSIDLRRIGIIGTNLFPNLGETPLSVKVPAPKLGCARGFDLISVLPAKRASENIEKIRAAASSFKEANGSLPTVFLARMGPVKQHKPRADFSAGFFSVGGFKAVGKETFSDPVAAAEAAAASGAPVAVLCSTDDTYPELVPAFAKTLKAKNPDVTVVLAGLPTDAALVASFKEAGIDEFIHVRANVRDVLTKLLNKIGATV